MKKQILLISAVVLSSMAMAQTAPTFSIRAGVSSSDMRGDAVNSLDNILGFTNGMIATRSRTGFFAGGSASIPIAQNFSVEPGLYYSQKGFELNGSLDVKAIEFLGVGAKAAFNTSYVDLPVLVKANFGGLEVFAGPQVSYLTKAELRTTAGALGFNVVDNRLDATNEMHRWDAGITGGIGYQFNGGLNIRASYDHGLTKADANRNLDTYNRVVKLGVGIRF
ncbi:MAG: PorT family protein [Flavisolibacter sp.]|jgi:hypothetical protein|nr:PorT family protein [Flavisolibacter sp.]